MQSAAGFASIITTTNNTVQHTLCTINWHHICNTTFHIVTKHKQQLRFKSSLFSSSGENTKPNNNGLN